MRFYWLITVALLIGCNDVAHAQNPMPRYRWLYASFNLQVDDNVPKLQNLMRRASAVGYNGVLLADYKFAILDRVPEHYFANVEKIKATARELQMQIAPSVCPLGYSSGLLAHDPNLAEGLPVRDAPFRVHNQTAAIAPDPALDFSPGEFEKAENNRFIGWDFQDGIGQSSFLDRATKHGGNSSLRMENIGATDKENGHGRVMKTIKVNPWRQYRLSVWIKTSDFETPGDARAAILTEERALLHSSWQIEKTQDWTQYHLVFNSLNFSQVRVYLGVWGGKSGKIWWDDARIEEVGLLNVLRREGCPLTVRGEDGTAYEEGRDFETVRDEKLGVVPWPGEYDLLDDAPLLRLSANSRIKDGQTLRVSFYSVIPVENGQVGCCLSDSKVYELLRDQIQRVNKLFEPQIFFMSHDEMRQANWCETCQKRKMTPGQLLADNVKRCTQFIREVNPKAEIFVWSDMFDPHHNAHDNYYLVNGSWAGSWQGFPQDVIIANWNFDGRKQSLPWFANLGNRQLLAGYYDDSPQRILTWLEDARAVKGVDGVMYTTWQNRYDDLEAFAQNAWGGKP